MNVTLSRHAKRRIKLYKLHEESIIQAVQEAKTSAGIQEILIRIEKQKYPVKIIFEKNENNITIITAYPLRKGLKQ